MDKGNGTALLARIRAEVANIHDVPPLLELRTKADALRRYYAQYGTTCEQALVCAEARIRMERRLGEVLAETVRAGNPELSHVATIGLDELGVSRSSSSRWQYIAAIPEPDFEAALERARSSVRLPTSSYFISLGKAVVAAERNADLFGAAQVRDLRAVEGAPFDIIYADPPWRYEDATTDPTRQIERQYPTMTIEELCELPVDDIAKKDSLLFLWATNPKLEESFAVLAAWGFTYRTNLVWVKDKIGLGHWVRQQHELLLLGARGKPGTPAYKRRVSSVIEAPRTRHSKKPDLAYELIESMYPDRNRVELFQRAPRTGWSGWGNEV